MRPAVLGLLLVQWLSTCWHRCWTPEDLCRQTQAAPQIFRHNIETHVGIIMLWLPSCFSRSRAAGS